MDSDDVQELLDSHNERLTIDELITMHDQEEVIDKLDSLDPVQLDDQMTAENLREALSSIKMCQRRAHFCYKTRSKKITSMLAMRRYYWRIINH